MDLKAAKQNKIEVHKEQLEAYERHADDLVGKREHTDRMFDFMKNQVHDISDLKQIEEAKDASDSRFRETFREQVEAPTEEIKKELDKDSDELFAESRNVMNVAERAEGYGVSDDVVSKLKSELGKSANEYQKMGQKARDTIAKSDEKVNASRLRVYGMSK